jgi:hypothetical protein
MIKNFIKIFFLLALVAFFMILESAEMKAQESTTTPETATTTVPSLPPEVQAALDRQANMKIETENFEVEFYPEHPGQNEKVSARVISYTFDVNRATIAWILNGKVAASGKSFSFITGQLGSKTNLTVSIITPDQHALSESFSFQAAEVDLLWETPGYVPPPYRGKVLAVSQSLIKVIAVPQGIKTAASKLIYEWRRNGKNLPASSGLGKNVFTFYGGETGEESIEVRVSTSDESAVADNSVLIKINEPKILFYENILFEGPQYQKELGENFTLAKNELALKAEPYFFSKRALQKFSYEWQINNKQVEKGQKPNLINLAFPEGVTKGISLISLSMSNPLNVLEMAEKQVQINFNLE